MANEPTASVVVRRRGSGFQGAVKFDGCGCDYGIYELSAYLQCGHQHRKRPRAFKCGNRILKRAKQALARSK